MLVKAKAAERSLDGLIKRRPDPQTLTVWVEAALSTPERIRWHPLHPIAVALDAREDSPCVLSPVHWRAYRLDLRALLAYNVLSCET
jgi:hypothetical protein